MNRYTPSMSPGGVLCISSDSDDWIMEAKIKNPKKSICLSAKPKKILGPKINPLKIPWQISVPYQVWMYLNCRTMQLGYACMTTNISSDCFEYTNKSLVKSSHLKKTFQIFLFKKIPESNISDPKKSFNLPCHLKSRVPALEYTSCLSNWTVSAIPCVDLNGFLSLLVKNSWNFLVFWFLKSLKISQILLWLWLIIVTELLMSSNLVCSHTVMWLN